MAGAMMVDLVLVGEAYGKEEEEQQRPFVGPSGRFLNALLHQAGINRDECFLTNVFQLRPRPTNDVKNLCGPRGEGLPDFPPLSPGKYVRREFSPELDRLFQEVRYHRPNLVVALGATPAWALLGTSGIKKIRGAPAWSERLAVKVLPTYHPAAVLRDYTLRPVLYADLNKAREESRFPELRRPKRHIYIEPSIDDLWWFKRKHLDPAPLISVDIETAEGMITCIGFAPNHEVALVVPFSDVEGSYWKTHGEEREAWEFVRAVLAQKKVLGQNFLYDVQYLWKGMGIPVPHLEHDTMLLHHALQPELQKGLGFLGSIYTNEAAWKLMRKSTTRKKED